MTERKYPIGEDPRTPITNAFAEWQKQATPEELQDFCDAANGMAKMLRLVHGIKEDPFEDNKND